MGRLERVVTAERLVSAIPASKYARTRPPKPPRPARLPKVVATLLKAMEWRRQIDAGEVPDQATIARREGVTRARVTQVLTLLRLAPAIQESILSLKECTNPARLPESVLRPIAQMDEAEDQIQAFDELADLTV